jgi:CheY-like chemotaxis protein
VAEDNQVNQQIALRMLARLGFCADAVPDGRAAVAAAGTGAYDLILMDVHMPELDGFAATAAIRAAEGASRHLPIVAMTARAMAGDRDQCLAVGMDDYISKPVRLEELSTVLERWVCASGFHPAEQRVHQQVNQRGAADPGEIGMDDQQGSNAVDRRP